MTGTDIHIPTLETERFRLRAPRLSDLDAHAAFRASDRARYIGGPFTRIQSFNHLSETIGHWPLRGYGRWIIADKKTDEPLGLVGPYKPEDWPEPEIAWSVYEAAEGKGIAYEAALASRTYAYDVLGWTTAVSLVPSANTRSAALARRLGAQPEGQYQSPVYGPLDIWRHPGPGEACA